MRLAYVLHAQIVGEGTTWNATTAGTFFALAAGRKGKNRRRKRTRKRTTQNLSPLIMRAGGHRFPWIICGPYILPS